MKFIIEQIALHPRNPEAARALLSGMGIAKEWIEDHVCATGAVWGNPSSNEADLQFNYEALQQARELEILHYTKGERWLGDSESCVSHIGTHCSEEELAEWKKFFEARFIEIAQEVNTTSHSNEAIKGKRSYHYCIFNTVDILGVDVKFIVRSDHG